MKTQKMMAALKKGVLIFPTTPVKKPVMKKAKKLLVKPPAAEPQTTDPAIAYACDIARSHGHGEKQLRLSKGTFRNMLVSAFNAGRRHQHGKFIDKLKDDYNEALTRHFRLGEEE